MRKISVLVTLAVLLLSMAGTASAVTMTEFEDGCYCVHLEGDYVPDYSQIPVPASASLQQTIEPYHIEVDAKVCKSGDEITVIELDSKPGVVIDDLVISSLYKEQIILSATGTCEMGCSFEGTMTLVGDGESYSSTSATGSVTCGNIFIPVVGSFTATIEKCPEAIPEFPNVALPMVAIIGLALIMQRRK